MKYQVGDKVRVHSLNWFKNNCSIILRGIYRKKGKQSFNEAMRVFCSEVVTIVDASYFYIIKEDDGQWAWEDWMFEGKVEEKVEEKPNISLCELLGVEEDEQFYINNDRLKVENNRLQVYNDHLHIWEESSVQLNILLFYVERDGITKKWKPKVGETVYIPYFGSTAFNYYEEMHYEDTNWNESLYRAGFVFKTSEEAVECAKKIIKQMKEG